MLVTNARTAVNSWCECEHNHLYKIFTWNVESLRWRCEGEGVRETLKTICDYFHIKLHGTAKRRNVCARRKLDRYECGECVFVRLFARCWLLYIYRERWNGKSKQKKNKSQMAHQRNIRIQYGIATKAEESEGDAIFDVVMASESIELKRNRQCSSHESM